ncbi:MAG: cupin domain-containing protein, partial [Pseudomonadota bacterium]
MPENRSYHLSCGKTRYVSFDSVSRNRLHKHTYFEPCIVISGSGEFEHGATTHALRAGDLFIADRGVFHEIRSLESRDLELYFLSFLVTDAQAGRTVARENLVPEPSITAFLARHRQHLPGQAHLVPLFEHVSRLGRREGGPRGERDVLDLSLLLVRQVVEALSDSASLSDDAYSDRLQKARVEEHIENHLH